MAVFIQVKLNVHFYSLVLFLSKSRPVGLWVSFQVRRFRADFLSDFQVTSLSHGISEWQRNRLKFEVFNALLLTGYRDAF